MSLFAGDVIRPWFEALEELNEFIGIRFGYRSMNSDEPEWQFFGHDEVDGIGGFVRILRQRGIALKQLPRLTHSERIHPKTLLQAIPGVFRSRKPVDWKVPMKSPSPAPNRPPVALAWHAFSAGETEQILRASKRLSVSVNSLLLQHFDSIVRRDLKNPAQPVFWMVPVNLRGKVDRGHDEENHSSYVTARIDAGDDVRKVHGEVHRRLALGQHLLTWKTYSAGRFLSSGIKKAIIKKNRAMAEPCLGAFSNLGQWDPSREWTGEGISGDWFFCPPVLRCQMISIGCLTFQNRLTLTLQIHPELTTDQGIADRWLRELRDTIKLDFG